MHNLKELKIWRKAMDLSREVYRVTDGFPSEEKYGLTNQIRRSAVSIVSNIAEGAGRNANAEFLYFLSVSNGFLYELQTQITLSLELQLAKPGQLEPLLLAIEELQKMNYGLQKSLKMSLKSSLQ